MKRGDLEALLEAALNREGGEGTNPIRASMVLSGEDRQVAACCAKLAEGRNKSRALVLRDPMMVLPCF